MKKYNSLSAIVVIGSIFISSSAFAYNSGNVEERCLAPKFKTFSPAEKTPETEMSVIAPESEVSFTVSGVADPTTIRAEAKGIKLKLNVVDRKSYYQVSSILPPELNGKYVRVHLKAKAQKGDCVTKDGWLFKVRKAEEIAAPATAEE